MSDATLQYEDPLIGDPRSRIIAAAATLIAGGGSEAVTTRAVAAAASVQAPAIYRLFGDKDGLMDAVAERTLADYVIKKTQRQSSGDPVEDLREAWDAHVEFGLAHPAVFMLMHNPRSGAPSKARAAGIAVLRDRVRQIARAGRLRVSEERAVDLLDSMGAGTILTLLRMPVAGRSGLPDAAREAIFPALFSSHPFAAEYGVAGAASALLATLEEFVALSPGERHLLGELLQRIANAH
jgi:AcrR family transcriptional regulator